MAPKRKSDAAEATGSRRSTRTASTSKAATKEQSEENVISKAKSPKPMNDAPVEIEKRKATQESEREEEGQEEEEPATKKTKTGKVNVGDSIPDIILKDSSDNEVNLSSEGKVSGIVLFSYPAASTPGCTSQACSYRDRYEEITKRGYKVFGISTDTIAAQGKFKMKQGFKYPLLSDPKKQLLSVLGGSTSGKKTALRCHWVFSPGGTLRAVEINVKPKDCVDKALKSIDAIREA